MGSAHTFSLFVALFQVNIDIRVRRSDLFIYCDYFPSLVDFSDTIFLFFFLFRLILYDDHNDTSIFFCKIRV